VLQEPDACSSCATAPGRPTFLGVAFLQGGGGSCKVLLYNNLKCPIAMGIPIAMGNRLAMLALWHVPPAVTQWHHASVR
jgi:hypothetical protein